MVAKLSDFLLKVIWKHFKDVVTSSLTLTLPWEPSFYSYVLFKNYIFVLRELKGLLTDFLSRRNRTILLISLNVSLSLMHLGYVFLHLKSTPQVV